MSIIVQKMKKTVVNKSPIEEKKAELAYISGLNKGCLNKTDGMASIFQPITVKVMVAR